MVKNKKPGIIILKKIGNNVINPGLYNDDMAGELLNSFKTEQYIDRIKQTFGEIIERQEDYNIKLIVPIDKVGVSGFLNKQGFKIIKAIGLPMDTVDHSKKPRFRALKSLKTRLSW